MNGYDLKVMVNENNKSRLAGCTCKKSTAQPLKCLIHEQIIHKSIFDSLHSTTELTLLIRFFK